MSRSNGPLAPGRGVPPQQWQQAPEHDPGVPEGYPQQLAQRLPSQSAAGHGLAGHGHPGSQPTAPAYPSSQAAPTAPQGYYPAAPQQQASYHPQFDRYVAPAEPAQRAYDQRALQQLQQRTQAPQVQPPAYQPHTAAPAQPSHYDPHSGYPSQSQPAVASRGSHFDQWPPSAPGQAQLPPAMTPQAHPHQAPIVPRGGYDFSNYAPVGLRPQVTPAPPQDYGAGRDVRDGREYGIPSAPLPYQGRQPAPPQSVRPDDNQWQLSSDYDPRDAVPNDVAGYASHQQSYDQPAYGEGSLGGQLQAADDQHYDHDDGLEDEEEEAPRKSRRGLMVVSALVGAIAFGGGLAYAYKTFVKPSTANAQIGKVTAPKSPSKTQPTEAGGKQFPNQDSKLQTRLSDAPQSAVPPPLPAGMVTSVGPPVSSSAPPPAGNLDLDGGVKRVPTVVVTPDGKIGAPPPGMVISTPQPPRPPQVPLAVPEPAVQPVPRARIAEVAPPPPPQPRAAPAAVSAAPAEPAPPKKAPPQKKAPATRDDLAAIGAPVVGAATTAAAPAAVVTPRAGAGGGFVAVLASKNSRAEAERTNIELEQRFDVLKGKVFDVQEADLTAKGKGVVFRSVVGPPGSRAFASNVCSELKAVGFTDCWATNY